VEGGECSRSAFKVILRHIYDGQPHPVTGSPDYDSNTFYRIGDSSRHGLPLLWIRVKGGTPLRKNVLDEMLVIVGPANGSVVASRSGELALLRSALTRVVSEVNVRLFREPRKLHFLPNSKSSHTYFWGNVRYVRTWND
jgi:hypothetical protein